MKIRNERIDSLTSGNLIDQNSNHSPITMAAAALTQAEINTFFRDDDQMGLSIRT